MDTTTTHDLASDGALGIKQAAEWLGVSRSRLYELMEAGEIASVHIGRRRVVPRACIRNYLASLIDAQHPTRPAA